MVYSLEAEVGDKIPVIAYLTYATGMPINNSEPKFVSNGGDFDESGVNMLQVNGGLF